MTNTKKNSKFASCLMIGLLAFSACVLFSMIVSGVNYLGQAVGILPTTTLTAAPINTPLPSAAVRPVINPTQTRVSLVLPTAAVPQSTATNNSLEVTLSVPTQSTGRGGGQITVDSCIAPQTPQFGRVVEVVDGDTIKVLIEGVVYPVRYIGMDTPESTLQHEPYGKEASQENASLVSEKMVILLRDKSETDRFDRLLRYVYVGNTFVNRALVSSGYAQAKDYPPDIACAETFHSAELDARAALLGMWSGAVLQPTQMTSSTQIAQPTTASGGTVVIASVNKRAEYVTLKNVSGSAVNLNGWVLLSEKGSQSCTLAGMIPAGGTINIWSMSGTDGYSCGFRSDIWNNSASDPAVLYNPQGQEVSRK